MREKSDTGNGEDTNWGKGKNGRMGKYKVLNAPRRRLPTSISQQTATYLRFECSRFAHTYILHVTSVFSCKNSLKFINILISTLLRFNFINMLLLLY